MLSLNYRLFNSCNGFMWALLSSDFIEKDPKAQES